MEENKNVYNESQKSVEPKKKSNLSIILLFIVLLVAALVGGYYVGTLNKDNKTTGEEKKEISKEKVDEILENSYYSDFKGVDIVESGLDDESKLSLVFSRLEKDKTKDKSVDISTLYGKDKNVKKPASNEEDYELTTEINGENYQVDGDSHYTYDEVNTLYKSVFNEEAPKKSIANGNYLYYYCSAIDGYLSLSIGLGWRYYNTPVHAVKDYSVDGNKLTINVYRATYNYDVTEDDKIIITMDKDNSIKYTLDNNDSHDKMITDDMLKNHKDKLDVVKFIYTIDGDNYYLTEIKK